MNKIKKAIDSGSGIYRFFVGKRLIFKNYLKIGAFKAHFHTIADIKNKNNPFERSDCEI